MIKIKKAFTIVELMVSIMIVAILATISFYSYVWYLTEARDAERRSSVWEINSALNLYKQIRAVYPMPWDYFILTNSWKIVAYQWLLNENVTLSTMNKISIDPYTEKYFSYSLSTNKSEYQVALTLENWDFPIALLEWNYKTVSKNVLPSIILATYVIGDSPIEIHTWVLSWSGNRNLFIMDNWENIPYTITEPYDPFYAWVWIDNVLVNWYISFWQNSDYRTCEELKEAAKLIHDTWTEEYQLLNSNWALVNTWCTLP